MREESNIRKKIIKQIEDLYPPDSEDHNTATIGRTLLRRAREKASDWRNEPIEVLLEMRDLCRVLERENARSS